MTSAWSEPKITFTNRRKALGLWLEGKVGVPRPVAMLLRMLVTAQRRAH